MRVSLHHEQDGSRCGLFGVGHIVVVLAFMAIILVDHVLGHGTVLAALMMGTAGILMTTPPNNQSQPHDLLRDLRLYRAMLANTTQGVWIIDENARTIYVNAAMCAIMGRAEADVMGKTLLELLPKEQHTHAMAAFAERQHGVSEQIDYEMHRPDGTIVPTQVTASPIFDQDGTFMGASALFTDVTSLQQVRDALGRNNAYLDVILANTPIILFVLDSDGTILLSRGAGLSAIGFSTDEVVGENVFERFDEPPDMLDDVRLAMNGEPTRGHYQVFGRDFISYIDPVVLDEQNQKNGVIGVVLDMTDQTAAEAALRDSELRNQMILDTTDDIVYTQDADGRFTSLNAAFNRLLGYTAADWIGKPTADLLHPDDQQMPMMITRTLAGENVPIYEVRLRTHDDDYVTVEINQQPIRSDDTITGVLGIARDITQRRQVELRSLELALERERLVMLGRFVRDVSHDIRTPLSVISSNAYLARRKMSDGNHDIETHLRRIESHVNELGEHLTELLSLDQLSRQETHTYTDVNLNAIVSQVMTEYDLMAREKHHEMVFAPSNTPVIVAGDSDDLTRVVRHLLVNALNYTPDHGSIRVTVRAEDENAVITVQDNGIGISERHQISIFEPFFRVDTTRNHDTGGMGLGLNIAKLIVEAHQGRIEVSSAEDAGSTFRVILPLKA